MGQRTSCQVIERDRERERTWSAWCYRHCWSRRRVYDPDDDDKDDDGPVRAFITTQTSRLLTANILRLFTLIVPPCRFCLLLFAFRVQQQRPGRVGAFQFHRLLLLLLYTNDRLIYFAFRLLCPSRPPSWMTWKRTMPSPSPSGRGGPAKVDVKVAVEKESRRLRNSWIWL